MFRWHLAKHFRRADPPIQAGGLTVSCAREGHTHLVAPAGELDVATASQLEHELRRAEASNAREILVDLRSLDFIDSVGVLVLIRAGARSRLHGKQLLILRGPEHVHRIFECSGLTSRLPFVDSRPTPDAAIRPLNEV